MIIKYNRRVTNFFKENGKLYREDKNEIIDVKMCCRLMESKFCDCFKYEHNNFISPIDDPLLRDLAPEVCIAERDSCELIEGIDIYFCPFCGKEVEKIREKEVVLYEIKKEIKKLSVNYEPVTITKEEWDEVLESRGLYQYVERDSGREVTDDT